MDLPDFRIRRHLDIHLSQLRRGPFSAQRSPIRRRFRKSAKKKPRKAVRLNGGLARTPQPSLIEEPVPEEDEENTAGNESSIFHVPSFITAQQTPTPFTQPITLPNASNGQDLVSLTKPLAAEPMEDLLRIERRNRRAAVTVALTEAGDALRSPDASIEYLTILQNKLSRYLDELSKTELELRPFIEKDRLEVELQNSRTLQDRGTETICRLRLKIEQIKRKNDDQAEGRGEDAEFEKLIRLLEVSPTAIDASDFQTRRNKRNESKNASKVGLQSKQAFKEVSLNKGDPVERSNLVRRNNVGPQRVTFSKDAQNKNKTIADNDDLESLSTHPRYVHDSQKIKDRAQTPYGADPRPPTRILVANARSSCGDCFRLFARDFTRGCDKCYDYVLSTQNTSMLGGGGRVVKYLLFGANFIILLGGIVVFSVGAWALVDSSFMERLIGNDLYSTSAAALMASGCIVVIVSFLGCLGAFKEIRCLLIIYFLLLLVVFAIMIVGGVLGYVFRGAVDEGMYKEMWTSIPLYKNDTIVTSAWDEVQKAFKCCGMNRNGSDIRRSEKPLDVWRRNPNFNGAIKVPDSCCIRPEWLGGCRKNPTERDTYISDCYEKVRDFIKSHALVVAVVGISISCLVLVGMVFSCALIIIIK